jgi:hexosaminidase
MRRFVALTSLVMVLGTPAVCAAAPEIVPEPAAMKTLPGPPFHVDRQTRIAAMGAARPVGVDLAVILRRSTGYPLPVAPGPAGPDTIGLDAGGPARLGREGYRLRVTSDAIRLLAHTPRGLYRAVSTLRQLLPAAADRPTRQPGPWTVGGVRVADHPRFPWRGAMLDVARHFFSVREVERYLDVLALYKIDVLHLHLSDDQGWRIAIPGWPRLTSHGGSTEVGGGPGGFYTAAEYEHIVRYAARRFITVVPEVDGPGHVTAAQSSYAGLTCDGVAPPLFTGFSPGFTSLCLRKPVTYRFMRAVIRTLAGLTPGPYLHIGGDEAGDTPAAAYRRYVRRVQGMVRRAGKRPIGWAEISAAPLSAGTLAQYWSTGTGAAATTARDAVRQGRRVVMSPAEHAYLDQKYRPGFPLGAAWAGYIDVRRAYGWDPARIAAGVGERSVRGVEAPLWTETIPDIGAAEEMLLPRLPAIAEIGWSPRRTHSWRSFRRRLAGQAPRWEARGWRFYRSAQVPWPSAR